MLVSFDIKFTRRGLSSQSDVFLVEPVNLISKATYVVFYLSCIIRKFNGEKIVKQMESRRSFIRTC